MISVILPCEMTQITAWFVSFYNTIVSLWKMRVGIWKNVFRENNLSKHSGNALISCLLTDRIGVFYVRLSLKEKVKIAYYITKVIEIDVQFGNLFVQKNNIFFYFIYLCGRCLFVNLNMKPKRWSSALYETMMKTYSSDESPRIRWHCEWL